MKFSAIFDNRQKKERLLSGAAPPKELGHPLWRVLPCHSFTPSVVCLTIGLTPTNPDPKIQAANIQAPEKLHEPSSKACAICLNQDGWSGVLAFPKLRWRQR